MYDVCKQISIKVTYVCVFLGARCIYICQLLIKEYKNENEYIITVEPDFEKINLPDVKEIKEEKQTIYNEEFHLEGVDYNIKEGDYTLITRTKGINTMIKYNVKSLARVGGGFV